MFNKHLWRFSGGKTTACILVLLAACQGVTIIAQAYSLAWAISGLWKGDSLRSVVPYIIAFAAFFFFRQTLIFVRSKLLEHYSTNAGKTLRKQLISKILLLGPSFAQSQGTGNIVTTNIEGVQRVENYISLFGSKTIGILVVPLVIMVYAIVIDWVTALALFLALPSVLVFMFLLGKLARAHAAKRFQTYKQLSNHFVDTLRGLETLQFLGLSGTYGKTVEKTSESYRQTTMSTLRVAFMSGFALDFFSTLSVAVVALFLGLRLMNGGMELAPALTMLILTPEYFFPIREFGGDYHATLDGKKALEEIDGILKTPTPLVNNSPNPMPTINHLTRIDFSDISLIPDLTEQSCARLSHISLSVTGFQKIGITGKSGAGKTTLLEVIGGFLQASSGQIKINDTIVECLRHPSWQKQILYIPQHPFIFHATIADNIRFYTPKATNEEIMEAAGHAGLSELLGSLPLGINELIGEGGRKLSGGQEQRIVLARAFLDHSRKILLFDEPTAHIDIETEYELKKTMLKLMESKLVFFATHRLHWMPHMDRVIHIENGQIITDRQQGISTFSESKKPLGRDSYE